MKYLKKVQTVIIHFKQNLSNNVSQLLIIVVMPFILLAMAYYIDPNDLAMVYINPHPYLVTSVLFSSYFGLRFAILYPTVLSLLYFYLLNYQIDFQIEESIFRIKFVAMPLTMIFCSIVLGDIIERLSAAIKDEKNKNSIHEKVLKNQRKTVTYIQDINKELQKRLVEKTDTISQIFSHTKELNEINHDILIHNFLRIISKYAQIQQSFFYTKVDHFKFALKDSYPENIKSPMGNSFNIKGISNKLVRKSFQEKKLFHINSIENPHHMAESIGDVLISGPIIVDNNIFGILIVTQMPFLSYLPTNFTILQVFLDWVSQSIKLGISFNQNSSMGIIDNILQIFKKEYFEERMNSEIKQANKYNLSLCLMYVNIKNLEHFNKIKRIPIIRVVLDTLKECVRKTDIITLGNTENEFYIGLPMANKQACESISLRFNKKFTKFDFIPDDIEKKMEEFKIKVSLSSAEINKDIADITQFKDVFDHAN